MDPVALSTMLASGALVAAGGGAAAGLTEAVKQGVVDAYAACKKAIRSRFGDDEDAKEKLAQLEVRPDDDAIRDALTGYLTTHGVTSDQAVVTAAEALRGALGQIEGGVGSITTGHVVGNVVSADRGGVAAVNLTGGVTAGYTAGGESDRPR